MRIMESLSKNAHPLKRRFAFGLSVMCWLLFSLALEQTFGDDPPVEKKRSLDQRLIQKLRRNDVQAIDLGPTASSELVELGQALFFDPILSGNRDTACSTCHHPKTGTGDQLSLGIGTGTTTSGKVSFFREKGAGREFIPRNAPELFNKGSVLWTTQFWDSRVATAYGSISSPAGDDLPSGLSSPLAVQAMFPVTSTDEMRGSIADWLDPHKDNEIADPALDGDLPGIWRALMNRLQQIDGYADPVDGLFVRAFGEVPGDLGFESVATALAAFESTAYSFDDSPFDEYLKGNRDALTKSQKRGALLFYGKFKCASCHSGTLLTDQKHYNLAIPQFGPGKDESGLDLGRYLVTGDPKDRFKFRVPGLRNVAQTAPYMHNGAHYNLAEAITHHLDPAQSLMEYDPNEKLIQGAELADTYIDDRSILRDLIKTADVKRKKITPKEISYLLEFMQALTAPDIVARLESTIPSSVPSGLQADQFGE